MSLSTILSMTEITKSYQLGENKLQVLKGINFDVKKGDLVSIMGPSGSGKSTLMNIIGMLDHPDSGSYILNEQEVARLTSDERAVIRNKDIGFVFQSFYLLSRLTAVQNVSLPLFYRGVDSSESKKRSLEMLKRVGMYEYASHKPNELSGGQQQRVAIARALVGKPSIILADEPTGALDSKIGQEVMDFFIELNETEKNTIIIITHDANISSQCKTEVRIQDGLIVEGRL